MPNSKEKRKEKCEMNEFKISLPAAGINAKIRRDDVVDKLNQQALEEIGYRRKETST